MLRRMPLSYDLAVYELTRRGVHCTPGSGNLLFLLGPLGYVQFSILPGIATIWMEGMRSQFIIPSDMCPIDTICDFILYGFLGVRVGNTYRVRRSLNSIQTKKRRRKLLMYSRTCFWCGDYLTDQTITLDHKIPLSQNGSNRMLNFVLSCLKCNSLRGCLATPPVAWGRHAVAFK